MRWRAPPLLSLRTGPRRRSLSLRPKIRAGEAAGKVAEIAHQVHGAIGFTSEHILVNGVEGPELFGAVRGYRKTNEFAGACKEQTATIVWEALAGLKVSEAVAAGLV